MGNMLYSYDKKEESEQNNPSGTRVLVVSLTEELELDRVDYETMLEEIRI